MSRCPECDKALLADDRYGHDCEVEPCSCPVCDSHDDSLDDSGCLRNFCALCREELGYESDWPDLCGRCIADESRIHDLA